MSHCKIAHYALWALVWIRQASNQRVFYKGFRGHVSAYMPPLCIRYLIFARMFIFMLILIMEIRSGGPTGRSRGAGVPSFRPKMKTELTNQSASNMKKIEKKWPTKYDFSGHSAYFD